MPSSSFLLAICLLALSVSGASAQHTYSKAVQRACSNDYKRHCGHTVLKPRRFAFAWIALDKD